MTIYEIKEASRAKAPYFFSAKSLKFFNQTMKSFKVHKQEDGRYLIMAPMKDHDGRNVGTTTRFFNPANGELERN